MPNETKPLALDGYVTQVKDGFSANVEVRTARHGALNKRFTGLEVWTEYHDNPSDAKARANEMIKLIFPSTEYEIEWTEL